MTEPLKIAIAGLGTVGAGLVELVQRQQDLLRRRCGRGIQIVGVSARDRTRDRGCDLSGIDWYDDAVAMATEASSDIFVELIGGSDGVAREACIAAIEKGQHIVTANKALMAMHGTDLARRAEASHVTLAYEAAVAGGIPIIKAIREGLTGNAISGLHGILNGTSNYILSVMRDTGRDFDSVLSEAQALGYAEADPTFDIDGVDAGHKLALLSSLAFGTEVDFAAVHLEGIRDIVADDMRYARELGFEVKLLGIAQRLEDGVRQRVHPALVPLTAPIAAVDGVFNAVVTEGDFVGTSVFEGRGAGAGPTASAVIADICDIGVGRGGHAFGMPAAELAAKSSLSMDGHVGEYYVRLKVLDKPGVIADVTAILRDESISMESIIQRGRSPDEPVDVVLTTHDTRESAMMRASSRIGALEAVCYPPFLMRIERY